MSKRSLFVRLVPCRCLRGEEEIVTSLDYSHCSLETVPKEIFSFEKTLQELFLDANQIEELPKVRRMLWCIETFSVYIFVAKSVWMIQLNFSKSQDVFTSPTRLYVNHV